MRLGTAGSPAEFIELLRANRADKAYQLTTASFQKKMYPLGLPGAPELRASDPLIKKYPAIMKLERTEHRQHKVKKSSDNKAYEYFCHAREYNPRGPVVLNEMGNGPWVELTLTIIQKSGAWKVDKLEVDMESLAEIWRHNEIDPASQLKKQPEHNAAPEQMASEKKAELHEEAGAKEALARFRRKNHFAPQKKTKENAPGRAIRCGK
jgi:hypothetical protein